MFYPARLWVYLLVLALGACQKVTATIEQNTSGTGGSLINSQNILRHVDGIKGLILGFCNHFRLDLYCVAYLFVAISASIISAIVNGKATLCAVSPSAIERDATSLACS